jgi:hypothetical protein
VHDRDIRYNRTDLDITSATEPYQKMLDAKAKEIEKRLQTKKPQ